jgi:hypothetical protein
MSFKRGDTVPMLEGMSGRQIKSKSKLSQWECVECTFINKPKNKYCDMCGVSKGIRASNSVTLSDQMKKDQNERPENRNDLKADLCLDLENVSDVGLQVSHRVPEFKDQPSTPIKGSSPEICRGNELITPVQHSSLFDREMDSVSTAPILSPFQSRLQSIIEPFELITEPVSVNGISSEVVNPTVDLNSFVSSKKNRTNWDCSQCTFQNSSRNRYCEVCFAENPDRKKWSRSKKIKSSVEDHLRHDEAMVNSRKFGTGEARPNESSLDTKYVDDSSVSTAETTEQNVDKLSVNKYVSIVAKDAVEYRSISESPRMKVRKLSHEHTFTNVNQIHNAVETREPVILDDSDSSRCLTSLISTNIISTSPKLFNQESFAYEKMSAVELLQHYQSQQSLLNELVTKSSIGFVNTTASPTEYQSFLQQVLNAQTQLSTNLTIITHALFRCLTSTDTQDSTSIINESAIPDVLRLIPLQGPSTQDPSCDAALISSESSLSSEITTSGIISKSFSSEPMTQFNRRLVAFVLPLNILLCYKPFSLEV